MVYYASRRKYAAMAQSVEHVIGNDEVISSILISSSRFPATPMLLWLSR